MVSIAPNIVKFTLFNISVWTIDLVFYPNGTKILSDMVKTYFRLLCGSYAW